MGAMATEFATTKEACDEAQVPQVWRDACAHLLIPLNACRKKEFYLPWKYVNTNTTLMLSAAHLLEVWGGRNAPQTPHTRPTQAIASALTPKFYSISTLPFSFLFLDTNRTTSFSFVGNNLLLVCLKGVSTRGTCMSCASTKTTRRG